jgi:demethylmenaquinone methyltransferase/2-methoxy-6-polyprenyl-1,4-benzoquinol methylase
MANNTPSNFERYERIAAFYDCLDLPFEYGWYRRIRPRLFRDMSGRILDVGVGTGRNFPFYPAGTHVVGVDSSPAMLARAKRRIASCAAASIELKTMDASALDFPDDSFDAVVATFLFCVLPDESQLPVLRELGRVVKAGGMIRLLNYVRPRGTVLNVIARLGQPFAAWAFAASFDRRTEESVTEAGLELLDSRYAVLDLIRLIDARKKRP